MTSQRTTLAITGMHCASCAALIKDVSSEFPAIKSVNVDLASKKVTLEYEDDFDLAKWQAEIKGLGETYKISPKP